MNKFTHNLFLLLLALTMLTPLKVLKAQDGILSEISYLYLNKLIAAANENYPRIKNYNSQIAAAKNDLSSVKISWLDPISFQFVSRSNRASSNLVNVTTADILNGYQFGIALNPGSLLARPSQIKKAKEQVKIAQFEREEYFLRLEAEVKTRYFTYLQAQKVLIPVNKALLDSENNFNAAKVAFEKAEITLQEYNSASINYNQAYANKLLAESTYLTAKASLEELTVEKLEDIR